MNHPWIKLDIDVPYRDILCEAKSVEHLRVEHRDKDYISGIVNKGWYSLTLYGVGSTITTKTDGPHNWTDVSTQCPHTVKFLKDTFEINDSTGRIRFMWLDPNGFIAPHRDKDYPGYGAVNIAIHHPRDCFFIFKNQGTVPYKSGEAYQIDTSYEHLVINKSKEQRLHIIVHSALKQ